MNLRFRRAACIHGMDLILRALLQHHAGGEDAGDGGKADGEQAGLMIMGRDYSYLALQKQGDELLLKQAVCEDAEYGTKESVVGKAPLKDGSLSLKVKVNNKGECTFSYSPDGEDYKAIGEKFQAREGKWIGAKVGLFTTRPAGSNGGGYTEFDYFRIK